MRREDHLVCVCPSISQPRNISCKRRTRGRRSFWRVDTPNFVEQIFPEPARSIVQRDNSLTSQLRAEKESENDEIARIVDTTDNASLSRRGSTNSSRSVFEDQRSGEWEDLLDEIADDVLSGRDADSAHDDLFAKIHF